MSQSIAIQSAPPVSYRFGKELNTFTNAFIGPLSQKHPVVDAIGRLFIALVALPVYLILGSLYAGARIFNCYQRPPSTLDMDVDSFFQGKKTPSDLRNAASKKLSVDPKDIEARKVLTDIMIRDWAESVYSPDLGANREKVVDSLVSRYKGIELIEEGNDVNWDQVRSAPLPELSPITTRTATSPYGFHNFGNSCYFNAFMQALVSEHFNDMWDTYACLDGIRPDQRALFAKIMALRDCLRNEPKRETVRDRLNAILTDPLVVAAEIPKSEQMDSGEKLLALLRLLSVTDRPYFGLEYSSSHHQSIKHSLHYNTTPVYSPGDQIEAMVQATMRGEASGYDSSCHNLILIPPNQDNGIADKSAIKQTVIGKKMVISIPRARQIADRIEDYRVDVSGLNQLIRLPLHNGNAEFQGYIVLKPVSWVVHHGSLKHDGHYYNYTLRSEDGALIKNNDTRCAIVDNQVFGPSGDISTHCTQVYYTCVGFEPN
ncbi:MAG: hypothetical protein MRY21_01370 [Simkaniaceae bacterium]|nr:hypothetical protein [Simkaniaceae bacterium]